MKILFAFLALGALAFPAQAETLLAHPSGVHEVAPSLISPGTSVFIARVSHDDSKISFLLKIKGVPTQVMAAHIHLGDRGVVGGVMVPLCGVAPLCPQDGKIWGTLTSADVIAGVPGLMAGDLASVLAAIRKGATYVNIHSMEFPQGELRDQIRIKK